MVLVFIQVLSGVSPKKLLQTILISLDAFFAVLVFLQSKSVKPPVLD